MTKTIAPWAEYWKFRNFDNRLLEVFENKELWLSTPEFFNDPFDCQVDIQNTFSAVRTQLNEHLDERISSIVSAVERHVLDTNYAYLCLCRVWNQTLMWSHYADNHTGVALGFSFESDSPFNLAELTFDEITYETSALKDQLTLVNDAYGIYLQHPVGSPGIMAGEAQDFAGNFHGSLLKLYEIVRFMKAECWSYEEEFRFEAELENRNAKGTGREFAANDLKHVMFGTLCPQIQERVVRKLLAHSEWDHVQFWRCKKDSVNLVLSAERIE